MIPPYTYKPPMANLVILIQNQANAFGVQVLAAQSRATLVFAQKRDVVMFSSLFVATRLMGFRSFGDGVGQSRNLWPTYHFNMSCACRKIDNLLMRKMVWNPNPTHVRPHLALEVPGILMRARVLVAGEHSEAAWTN